MSLGLLCSFVSVTYSEETSPSTTSSTEKIKKLEQEGIERIHSNQESQKEIDKLVDENTQLAKDYYKELQLISSMETYIDLLDKQIASQNKEIETLNHSILEVATTERQILPLLLNMVDALEQFVDIDTPFLPEERQKRVEKLRSLITRADITIAEKCRRVFEAFEIENEYGRTIESYTGKLPLAEGSYDAEFLRIGRVALLYKTIGNDNVGYWDKTKAAWKPLKRSPWLRLIQNGLKVAKQEVAPQLIYFPLDLARLGE